MKQTIYKQKEDNTFERLVEMFEEDGADMVLVRHIDGEIVTGCPYNSKTGTEWFMDVISSLEELKKCKYKKAVPEELVEAYGEESE